MEPERKIEKWLRAFAKKRRGDAGDFKLHPATRRLLQGEVSRRTEKVKADAADDEPSLWQLFRQQWAFLIAFAVIMFFAATMILPSLSSAKKRSANVIAMSNLKEVGEAAKLAAEENNGKLPATLEEMTNGFIAGRALTNPVSGQKIVYVAGGMNLDDLRSNDVLAFVPTDKDRQIVLFADGRVQAADREQFKELTNQKPMQLALAEKMETQKADTMYEARAAGSGIPATPPPQVAAVPSAALQPATAASGALKDQYNLGMPTAGETADLAKAASPSRRKLELPAGQLNGQTHDFGAATFQNTANLAQNAAQNAFRNAAAKAIPVLVAFQIEQNGNAIRVVDADGSVYDGTIENTNVLQNAPVLSQADANTQAMQQPQSYNFRVAGTNLTLKQNVEFAGNISQAMPALAAQNAQPSVNQNIAQTFAPNTQTTPAESAPSNSEMRQQSLAGGAGGGGGNNVVQQAATQSQTGLQSNVEGARAGGSTFQQNQNQAGIGGVLNQSQWSNTRIAGTAIVGQTNQIEINAFPVTQ